MSITFIPFLFEIISLLLPRGPVRFREAVEPDS